LTRHPLTSRVTVGVAVALGLFIAAYRFNTLGGALGGFDNDHFIYFVYAKEVQAGAQPLRDFLDFGLQGARPSLMFELSALAQRGLGNTLWSEAVLSVAGLAAASALTFIAAAQVAPWPAALAASIAGSFLAPKLYNYPKVLVLAGAVLLIVRYATAASWRYVALMAAWTAVAFLFRHDYAVHCAVGLCLVIVAAHGPAWRTSLGRLAGFGVLTLVLLTPSLLWVQRYAGISEYFRNGLALARREMQRTDRGWPAFTTVGPDNPWRLLDAVENAEAWLYYLVLALPIVTFVVLLGHGLRRRTSVPAVVGVAGMTAVLAYFFLRGNLEGRLGDMFPAVAVLAAILLSAAFRRDPNGRLRLLPAAVTVVMAALSLWAIDTIGSVRSELNLSGLSVSPAKVVRQAMRVSGELVVLPGAVWEAPEPRFSMHAAQYLHRCTRDEDRVAVLTYAPEIIAFSGRRLGGGRSTVSPGFYTGERYTTFVIDRLKNAHVPIVLAEGPGYYDTFPELHTFLETHYRETGTIEIDGGRTLHVWTLPSGATGTFGTAGWPCFS
jgi:hypothetical protein